MQVKTERHPWRRTACAWCGRAARRRGAGPLVAVAATLAGMLAAHPAAAAVEPPTGRWSLGLEGGIMKLQEGSWDYSAADQFGRVRLGRGLGRHWSLHAAWMQGYVRPGVSARNEDAGWTFTATPPYHTLMRQPMLELEHRLSPGARFSPTLVGGIGLTKWRVINPTEGAGGWFPAGDTVSGYDSDGNPAALSATDLTLGFGLGLDVALGQSLRLGLGARYQVLQGDGLDNIGLSERWGPDYVDANTALASAWAGVTWWFGSSDADRDGVPDKDDQCPRQAEDRDGFADLDGCPDPDNDGDGIADTADACPQLAEDVDGYRDQDGCPDLDNDGDGIADARDRCPDAAEDVNGLDDTDGCPDQDADQDGVPDGRDKCPGTEADSKVDKDGCPVAVPISPDRAEHHPAAAADFVLDGVSFATGSAVLTREARLQLEDIAAWAAGEPGTIEIRGYTDDTGSPESNRSLSLRRAVAVRDLLIERGLPSSRLKALGYGAADPVADNTTPEGRARNRRVEIRRLP